MRFNNLTLLLTLSCLAFFTACSNQNNSNMNNTFNIEEVKTYINKANETYDHRQKGDPSFFASVYTKDALVMPAGSPKLKGMENIIGFFKVEEGTPPFKVNVLSEEITGNEENVFEVGTYEIVNDKNESFEKGKFIVVWKQENGTWKIHREIWNTNTQQQSE